MSNGQSPSLTLVPTAIVAANNYAMPDLLSETIHSWQNFYFMTGGAAATLIGLIFVAVSLGSNLVSEETQVAIDVYVTPILFYFISVLILACLMLVPAYAPLVFESLMLLFGLIGLGRVSGIVLQMIRKAGDMPISFGHWLWHALLPGLSYGLIAGTAGWMLVDGLTVPFVGFALATGILLISGIWRTWELVLWIAHQRAAPTR